MQINAEHWNTGIEMSIHISSANIMDMKICFDTKHFLLGVEKKHSNNNEIKVKEITHLFMNLQNIVSFFEQIFDFSVHRCCVKR